jgi:hypothetical protein
MVYGRWLIIAITPLVRDRIIDAGSRELRRLGCDWVS